MTRRSLSQGARSRQGGKTTLLDKGAKTKLFVVAALLLALTPAAQAKSFHLWIEQNGTDFFFGHDDNGNQGFIQTQGCRVWGYRGHGMLEVGENWKALVLLNGFVTCGVVRMWQ